MTYFVGCGFDFRLTFPTPSIIRRLIVIRYLGARLFGDGMSVRKDSGNVGSTEISLSLSRSLSPSLVCRWSHVQQQQEHKWCQDVTSESWVNWTSSGFLLCLIAMTNRQIDGGKASFSISALLPRCKNNPLEAKRSLRSYSSLFTVRQPKRSQLFFIPR